MNSLDNEQTCTSRAASFAELPVFYTSITLKHSYFLHFYNCRATGQHTANLVYASDYAILIAAECQTAATTSLCAP